MSKSVLQTVWATENFQNSFDSQHLEQMIQNTATATIAQIIQHTKHTGNCLLEEVFHKTNSLLKTRNFVCRHFPYSLFPDLNYVGKFQSKCWWNRVILYLICAKYLRFAPIGWWNCLLIVANDCILSICKRQPIRGQIDNARSFLYKYLIFFAQHSQAQLYQNPQVVTNTWKM